jgi:hypothetical protein
VGAAEDFSAEDSVGATEAVVAPVVDLPRRSGRIAHRPAVRFSPRSCLAQVPAAPVDYHDAMSRHDALEWQQAMNEEVASLAANNTWSILPLPRYAKPIPCRWVFALKQNTDGTIARYKARLVAKRFKQRPGVDFDEVFAPVSKHTTIRVFLSLVASEDLECHQLDIKTAFVNGVLDETIYMHQPPGFVSSNFEHACHLHKALYGLRQASRAWHTCLKEELTKHSLVPSQADAGLFIRHGKDPVYVLVYVDDLLIASKHLSDVDHVKQCIMSAFQARDLGNASYFLGMDILRDHTNSTPVLGQRKYMSDVLSRFGMEDANGKSLPACVNTVLKVGGEPLDVSLFDYAGAVGCLQYLAT